MKKRFWNWARDETNPEKRTLLLEGPIAEESWYGDEVTPAAFREELFSADGPIVISVNSPGGDTIAASQIYTMLREYPDDVTVKITGIAASAASVIAMAGTKVCMSPTAMMMIHNPFTIAMGDSEEMRRAGQLLDEVKESLQCLRAEDGAEQSPYQSHDERRNMDEPREGQGAWLLRRDSLFGERAAGNGRIHVFFVCQRAAARDELSAGKNAG